MKTQIQYEKENGSNKTEEVPETTTTRTEWYADQAVRTSLVTSSTESNLKLIKMIKHADIFLSFFKTSKVTDRNELGTTSTWTNSQIILLGFVFKEYTSKQ